MTIIKNVIKSSGAITYWEEDGEAFTVVRNTVGRPLFVSSKRGSMSAQRCDFKYNATTNEFIGLAGSLETSMLPSLIADANGAVMSSVNLTGVSSLLTPVSTLKLPAGVTDLSGGGIFLPPLRVVATNQRTPGAGPTAGGTTKRKGRIPFQIGSGDVSQLVILFPNIANGNAGDYYFPASYTMDKVSIEMEGSTKVVPVLFSGNRSGTIPAGSAEFMSDPLLPSAFGLTSFSRGSKWWIRYEASQVDGSAMPAGYMCDQNTGSYGAYYAPASTTISDVDTYGPMVKLTGSNPFTMPEAYSPIILGRFCAGDPAVSLSFGDSLTWGSNDTEANVGFVGYGVPARSAYDSLGRNPIAGLIIARSGNNAGNMSESNTAMWNYFKYCTHGYEALGTNDLGAAGASSNQSIYDLLFNRKTAIWAGMRAAGIRRVASMEMLPNTTSTDGYITDTNQTATIGWGSGGMVDIFRDRILAQVGVIGGIDTYVLYTAVRWAGERWLWASAPANSYHWGPTLQPLAAPELRDFWTT